MTRKQLANSSRIYFANILTFSLRLICKPQKEYRSVQFGLANLILFLTGALVRVRITVKARILNYGFQDRKSLHIGKVDATQSPYIIEYQTKQTLCYEMASQNWSNLPMNKTYTVYTII